MPKRPKHKRGFTWSHYFDEWWDRVGEEFKIKLFVSMLLLILTGGGLGFYFWFQQYEKKELLEMAQIRQQHGVEISEKAQEPISVQKAKPAEAWNPRED